MTGSLGIFQNPWFGPVFHHEFHHAPKKGPDFHTGTFFTQMTFLGMGYGKR